MPKYLYICSKKLPITDSPVVPYVYFKKNNITSYANLGESVAFASKEELNQYLSNTSFSENAFIISKNNMYYVVVPSTTNGGNVDGKWYDLHYYADRHLGHEVTTEYGYTYTDYNLTDENIEELTNIIVMPDASYAFCGAAGYRMNVGNYNASEENYFQKLIRTWDMSHVTSLAHFFGGNITGDEDYDDETKYGCPISIIDLTDWNVRNVEDMSFMFSHCENLESVNMSGWNTGKLRTIKGMFSGASSEDAQYDDSDGNDIIINLDGWNTSNVIDMSFLFSDNISISQNSMLDILSNFDTSNVIDMSHMFKYTKIKNISNLNTSKVKNMESMFEYSKLEEVPDLDYSNVENLRNIFKNTKVTECKTIDTSKVKDMGGMFNNAALKSIALLDTSNVERMDNMFYECWELTEIPEFNTPKLEDTSYMFNGCRSLVSVPLFDTSNVTDMSGMFYDCNELTSIPHFNTSNVETMFRTFEYASKISSIPQFNTSKVTTMERAFRGCGALTNVPTLDASNVTDMSEAFESSGLKSVNFSGWNTNKVTNMNNMFAYSEDLTDVSGLDMDNCNNIQYMFRKCTKLVNPGLANANTSKVEYAKYAFSESNISSIPYFNTANVKDMSYMFYKCTNLKTLTENNWYNTSSVRRFSNMFEGCSGLPATIPFTINCRELLRYQDIKDMFRSTPVTSVTLSHVHSSIKDKINGLLLKGNSNLKVTFVNDTSGPRNIKLENAQISTSYWSSDDAWQLNYIYPDTYKTMTIIPDNIDISELKSCRGLFQACESLTSIPNIDTSNIYEMNWMFNNCKSITTIPSLNTSKVWGMEHMFYNCINLTTVPQLDTSKVTHMDNMFYGCTSLPTTFPWTIDCSSVTEAYGLYNIFGGSSVTSVTLKNVPEDIKPDITPEYIKKNGEITITFID